MSEIKKYTDIVRLGHKSTVGVLNVGDHITITEKVDGANSSFVLNENGEVDCFSHKQPVTEDNTLRGFYGWVHTNIKPEMLNPKYRYFGEWLVSHKIQYRPECYQNFYLFNVYDDEKEEYLSDDIMRFEAERLGIKTVPLIYEGEYISFDHLMSFVGTSVMALNRGEGIVVKNVDYRDKYGHQMFVKLVDADFCEVQKEKKPKDPNQPLTVEQEFVNQCLTQARVDKMLRKLVDENIIPVEFGIEDMGIILRNMGSRLFDDIMKEEKDSLPTEYDEKLIKAAIGKKTPSIVKTILNNENAA
jgi:hypothetical protein